MPSRSSQLQAV